MNNVIDQQYLTSDLHESSDAVPEVVVLCVDVAQVVVDVVEVLVKLYSKVVK